MSIEVRVETHEQFVKRMDIERTELGRELRDGNLLRAWSVAVYIRQEINRRIELIEGDPE